MKILIYVNKSKDKNNAWVTKLKTFLSAKGVDYALIEEKKLNSSAIGDAVMVFGGDGTILDLSLFSAKNNIPIIGVNAGKLGFLTEYEKADTEKAVEDFIAGNLKKDERTLLEIDYKGKKIYSLNDVVVQRKSGLNQFITDVSVCIDDKKADRVIGDGVILCTPTGSTAYSLSAGGAVVSPSVNVFAVTPISAHSLSQRPIIFSDDSECKIFSESELSSEVFADGKFLGILEKGEYITIKKAPFKTAFLRKEDWNFYERLVKKLQNRTVNLYD